MLRRSQAELEFVPPMLLQRVDRLPSGPWEYEVKFDGFRMQAAKCSGRVRRLPRNDADHTRRFPQVASAAEKLKRVDL